MSELKPEVPTKSLSTTLIVGVSNYSLLEEKDVFNCSSTSYTVGVVSEAADNQPLGDPSRPIHAGASKALDSILRARVPESAILRDKSGEF